MQADGQQNWLRKAGGTSLDEAQDIAFSPSDNSYYVTGYFSGSSNFAVQSITSWGLSDGFLAKYDNNGEPLWARRYGGISSDRSTAVVCDNSGNKDELGCKIRE